MSDNQEQLALIALTLPDGTVKSFPSGTTGLDIAQSIGRKLAQDALALKIDGTLVDLNSPLSADAAIEIITFDSADGKDVFWHSSSHIMAQAIEELFPGSKFGAGPSIEQGFYYDVASDHRFREEDLRTIEAKMLEISKRDIHIQREEMTRTAAIDFFKHTRNDPYKVEILEDTLKKVDTVSLYHQDGFTDLCIGPHLPSTSKLKAVLLTNISSSYWRGD